MRPFYGLARSAMHDENAFGLLFAFYDLEDVEYALEPEAFVERVTEFRSTVLTRATEVPLGEGARAIDFGHAVYFEIGDGDQLTDPIAWLRHIREALVAREFAVTAVLAWDRMIGAPEDAVFAGGLERAWVDELVPEDARVTKLYLESASCPASGTARHALFLTEFFNSTVDRAAYIGDSIPDGLPIERVEVEDGRLVLPSGDPLEAEYVLTQPGIELDGRRVGTGTAAGLVLWQTDGAVRTVGAPATADVRTADCPA